MSAVLWIVTLGLVFVVMAVLAAATLAIQKKNMGYWLPAYINPPHPNEPVVQNEPLHIFLAVCDHWEPELNRASQIVGMEKVERWAREYPQRYAQFHDSDGRVPQHTFFFPAEEYRPEYLDRIGDLCRAGYGDVEVHLHHDNDTAEGLEEKLNTFRQTLFHQHGMLRKDPLTGEIQFGFIHGNWALCNSRPDGAWCGVDQELTVLLKTGCYADFTMPSAPSPTQTRIINSIYYARDIPGRRKSNEFGIVSRVGQAPPDDQLLMIQGPLTLDWAQRRKGVIPRIENGDITAGRAMSALRLQQWMRAGVHVRGQPNWVFIKLHTHGCHDSNINAWLGNEMQQFHQDLKALSDAEPLFNYHYVTAWEMAQLVHQAEAGASKPEIVKLAQVVPA